jgi:hypothetical protein
MKRREFTTLLGAVWSVMSVVFDSFLFRPQQELSLSHQAIPIRELDATANPPLQHNQLMSECRVLRLKSALRLERRGKQSEQEAEQRNHRR